MAKTAPTRIQLKGPGVREEAKAAGAIRPGDLVKLNSDGELIKNNSAGAACEKAFAVEDALQGNGIDDNYADDDRVLYAIQGPGDVVYAWLSGGEDAEPGEKLTSNGDGALKVAGGGDIPIAIALEDVDASDSNDVDERIRVRIL